MGIHDLLPHLPGGGRDGYCHSFYDLNLKDLVVPLDAAGPLWQFASKHAWDYLHGNHLPALIEWAHFLNYLRSICGWKLRVYMDGMDNVAKSPENERRRDKVKKAEAEHNLAGQIKNTPEYITRAVEVCKFLNIEVYVSQNEADPQVAYESDLYSLIAVTGDSDVLAYGKRRKKKVVLVKGFIYEWYRVIDLGADPTDYPLLGLYNKHGPIIFQLYAGCLGCDFTEAPSGIVGLGYSTFIALAAKVDGEFTPGSLAAVMWEDAHGISTKNGFESANEVEEYLQNIVDVYAHAQVYDQESNTIDIISGDILAAATTLSKKHMAGEVDIKTRNQHPPDLSNDILNMDYSQLIQQTAADASKIRGVHLPAGKTIEQCTVPDLRDFIAARGGKISGCKSELAITAKQYQFIETQCSKTFVDRNPNPNGILYAKIDTSGTRDVGAILGDVLQAAQVGDDASVASLIRETLNCYQDGLFDDNYDNISRVAPEMKESFIYKAYGHIGSSIGEKNIGDALKRCWYENEVAYHGIAFVPNSNKVILLSKAHASMKRDAKTKNMTDDGESPNKQQYLVAMELFYKEIDEQHDKHSLGFFIGVGRTYCGGCIAGKGSCRHRSERLWYQYHHWTKERLGIDKPSTLGICSWAPGGKSLNCGVRQKIYEQQTVKYEKTLKDQKTKIDRGVKRDCTEGICGSYQLHLGSRKQKPMPERFSEARVRPFLDLLKAQSLMSKSDST